SVRVLNGLIWPPSATRRSTGAVGRTEWADTFHSDGPGPSRVNAGAWSEQHFQPSRSPAALVEPGGVLQGGLDRRRQRRRFETPAARPTAHARRRDKGPGDH